MRRTFVTCSFWFLLLSLAGCMGYSSIAVPPSSPEPRSLSGTIRVTTRDGLTRELMGASIAGDSVIGTATVGAARVAIALQDVRRLETRQFQLLPTLGGLAIVVLVTATVALVLLIGALTSWD